VLGPAVVLQRTLTNGSFDCQVMLYWLVCTAAVADGQQAQGRAVAIVELLRTRRMCCAGNLQHTHGGCEYSLVGMSGVYSSLPEAAVAHPCCCLAATQYKGSGDAAYLLCMLCCLNIQCAAGPTPVTSWFTSF
jgi:hypothetical protein